MKYSLLVLSSIILCLSACSVPVANYSNVIMPQTVSQTIPSSDSIENAILSAGTEIGWTMQKTAPNTITGTITIDDKTATVFITYTSQTYTILYQDSQGLNYNNNTINKTYNLWVKNLDNAIYNSLHAL